MGEVEIGGAKNAALAILTAATMTDETVLIENLPDVSDINVLLEAIAEIGATVDRDVYKRQMPQSVLGGAAVMMFASILVSGIQLITKEPITSREITIVSVALGLGYGLGSTAGATSELPYYIQLIFGGSGIVPAAVAALSLIHI